jgi:crotonobetainyl-CoA:carnitine CoA-transferase CaiB-like acyl-CoA transferase
MVPKVVPYGVLLTADRPIMLGLAGDGLFASFAKLIGRGEWASDELPKTGTRRKPECSRDDGGRLSTRKRRMG